MPIWRCGRSPGFADSRASRRPFVAFAAAARRIGDLLMVLDAIHDARQIWPDAEIDLAVGSWNVTVAKLIPEISRIEVADAPWLSRADADVPTGALIRDALKWRTPL